MWFNYKWNSTHSVLISWEQSHGGWLQMGPKGLGYDTKTLVMGGFCSFWIKHMGVGHETESITLSLGAN